jgi:hypothetical protein
MVIQNFRIEKKLEPSTDWLVFGEIQDDNGNLLATFGEDGTSVNEWWVRQDDGFQASTVRQFALAMAQQIISGESE